MSTRTPYLRDARERERDRDRDRDEDEHSTSRRGGSDGDSSDGSDGDDDDDQHGGSGGGSSARRLRKQKQLAAEEKRAEIVVERTVIHEALIRRAIHKDLATFYDLAVVPLEHEIDLAQVERLVLSYCNIYAIANLQGFERLTHLQLDNNIIERIGNLGHLTNLRWLDLSFNNIRQIQGLDALVNLTDLSLTDNEITVIEGLDKLTKLNVLSIGNNQIKDLAAIPPLRKFTNLRALNLKNNPVCLHDDYHNTVFAYLTNLRYLDNVVIEASQFAKARDAKLDQLLILEAKEKTDEVAERERKLAAEQQSVLDEANLAGLSTLFADMIRADNEHPKIKVLPGFDAIQRAYREGFTVIIDEFSADILEKHHVKVEEKKMVDEVLEKVQSAAVRESRAEIDRFRHLQKRAFKAHTESLDRGRADTSILPALRAELGTLVHELLAIEMLLVEQVENILEEFEKAFFKLISENVLRINGAFRALLDASNKHLSQVYDLTHTLLERYTKDDTFTDDLDVRAILADKDVLNNAVSTSHENQEAKIAAKEDEVREREEGNGKRMVKQLRDAHRARNRKRVAEIYGFKSIEEAAIAQQEAQQDEEEDA